MRTKVKNLTDCFLKEWALYVKDVPQSHVAYRYVKAQGLAVSPEKLKIGQVRLLADIEPSLMVYVYRKVGTGFLWEIIPLSSFHFPATSGEALIGTRVYQFWNQQRVPHTLLSRSFAVDDVSCEERREIRQVQKYMEKGCPLPEYLKPAIGAPVRADQDVRLRYLEDFSIDEDTFRNVTETNGFADLTRLIISRAFSGYEDAAAAADVEGDYTAAVMADRFPRNAKDFKRQYVDCELKSQFLSLLPGERGERPLVYTWDGETPERWRDSPVAAYIARTGELFGTGAMNVKTRRIVIDDFSMSDGVSVPLEKASELRLVMVPPKE